MKIVITGGAGFIGSHLTENLVKNGYDITVFTYYNSFNTWGWLEDIDKRILFNEDRIKKIKSFFFFCPYTSITYTIFIKLDSWSCRHIQTRFTPKEFILKIKLNYNYVQILNIILS